MDHEPKKYLLILMAGFTVSALAVGGVVGYDYLTEGDSLQRILPDQHTPGPADTSEKP